MGPQTTWPEPEAAYVHVPFCAHRCGYCNFTLVAGRDDLVEPYLNAIELELGALKSARPVQSLFLGGGTPTHLALEPLERLLTLVRTWFPPKSDCEFSIEANPADLGPAKVELLEQAGVTRVSLGAQSFDDAKLRLLERDHRAADVRRAVELLRGRFASVSLDLIFAAPNETLAGWQRDLHEALRLEPDHISTYGLTYERGAAFYGRLLRNELTRLDEELERQLYAAAIDTLTAAGFEHYEVSNFAKVGHRCRHNEVYWTGRTYFAVGPGAARYIDGRRETNHRSVTTYLKRVLAGESPVDQSETLSAEDRAREMLVLGLRRLDGIDRAEFAERTGFDVDSLVGSPLARFVESGLMSDQNGRVKLTRDGLFVSDSIWPAFLRV